MSCLAEPELIDKPIVLYPAVNSIEVLQSTVDKRLLLFDIPGQGHKTKKQCGNVVHVGICPDCKSVHPHDYHCKNYLCPECYSYAAMQGADRAATKLVSVQHELRKMKVRTGYLNHIVISLPDEMLYEFLFIKGKNKGKVNFEKLREFFYARAKEIGISGGFLVIHSSRSQNEFKSALIEAQTEDGEKFPRIWKGIQSNVLMFDDWREYATFGIHAHITGFFKMKETSDQFYERTGGCTYKNITVERCNEKKIPVKPEDYESLKTIIAYELGHHAYRKGKNGITAFGIINDWKKAKEGTDYFYEKCDICDTELVQISPIEYDSFLSDTNSVILEGKKKILRSRPIIRYLPSNDFEKHYKDVCQKEIDTERVRSWLKEYKPEPVKKPVRQFVPYHVEADYVTLRVACRFKLNS